MVVDELVYGLVAPGMVMYGPATFVDVCRLNNALFHERTNCPPLRSDSLMGIEATVPTVTVITELFVPPILSVTV